jgi:hypothetical protein
MQLSPSQLGTRITILEGSDFKMGPFYRIKVDFQLKVWDKSGSGLGKKADKRDRLTGRAAKRV